jgi:hypothetical protein
MSESDKPTSGDDDWGGPEETPWQQQPPPPPPQQPPQYGQQPPQFAGGQQPPAYGQQQPQYGVPPTHHPGAAAIPNYLVHSILATLLCCPPSGIVGIVYATQVNGKLATGDLAGAQKASDQAKLWTIISVGVGFVGWVVYIAIYSSASGV